MIQHNTNLYTPILPYLSELRQLPRLSDYDLSYTIELYRLTRSIELRDALILHYLHIIPQLLARYATNSAGVAIDDLLQTASVKLIEVIELIPAIDIRDLTSYIITSINKAIIRELKKAI